MKRSTLLVLAGLGLSLTGLTLAQAGWLPSSEPATGPAATAEPDDSLNREAVARYRSNEPRHWRACLIQH
jgi:hypothetical protein